MAQIDLKNTTVYIYDGTDVGGSTTLNSAPANSDLTLAPKISASPGNPITITLINPGVDGSISVAVSGRDISVTLARATTLTSTAAQVKAAIEASAAANALVTVTAEGDGTGIVEAQAKTAVTDANSITVKIGEGNLTYSEKRPVEFTRDRGLLDTVREADDEPMDVQLDFTWDWISSESGELTPTVEEALKGTGPASAWVNASTDPCRPRSVNIAILNAPACSSVGDEVIELLEFYYEELNHDMRAGQVSITGRCNRTEALVSRLAAA
jgi:hypothetical protein